MASGSNGLNTTESSCAPVLPDNNTDYSVLQQPLYLGVKNVKQILKCVQSGSPEVKDLILNECNIIYECKVCLNLFRSLANFMYHKRAFCKSHQCESMLLFETFDESSSSVVYPVPEESKIESKQNKNDSAETVKRKENISCMESDTSNNVPLETELDPSSPIVKVNPLPVDIPKEDTCTLKTYSEKNHCKKMKMDDLVSSESCKQAPGHINNKELAEYFHKKLPVKELDDGSIQKTRILRSSIYSTKCKDVVDLENITKSNKNLGSETQVSQASYEKPVKCNQPSEAEIDKQVEVVRITLEPIKENPNAVLQHVQKTPTTEGTNDVIVITDSESEDVSEENKNKEESEGDPTEKIDSNSKGKKLTENVSKSQFGKGMQFSKIKRLLGRTDCKVTELTCTHCQMQFTTSRAFHLHMMSFHAPTRIHYPCPFCKTLFVQMYGVTRHLMQVHGKRKDQINSKLKEAIRKKAVLKRVHEINDKPIPNVAKEHSSSDEKCKVNQKIDASDKMFHSYVKVERSVFLHYCSKCNRVFSRKSSQVSHEKFCIMNSRQEQSDISRPSSSHTLKVSSLQPQKHDFPVIRISTRPKRAAEKQMHKDFVNSQTLKWRSANKIETTIRSSTPVNLKNSKNHERKINSIVNVTKLLCLKCNKKFSSFSNLRRHAAIHIGWTRYKCTFCNTYQSYNRSDCRHHVERTHSIQEEDLDRYVVSLVSDIAPEKMTSNQDIKSSKDKCCKAENKGLSQNKRKQSVKNITHVRKKDNPTMKSKSSDQKSSSTDKKSSDKKKISLEDNKKTVEAKKTFAENKKSPENKKASAEERKQTTENKKSFDLKKDKTFRKDSEMKQAVPCAKSSYKSVTTNNPTTIILSKTCSSSSVQIVKNHGPISLDKRCNFLTNISVRKVPVEENSKKESNAVGSKQIMQVVPCKIIQQSDNDNNNSGKLNNNADKSVKKNRTISDWLTKKTPTLLPVRRDTAPLIIGLVPASNASDVQSKPSSSSS